MSSAETETESLSAFIGEGTVIDDNVIVGLAYHGWTAPARIGRECVLRRGTVIFADTVAGDRVQTGMAAYIREHTVIGDDCLIGTETIIEGRCDIADSVVIQSGVFIPAVTKIGNRVFIGPRAVLTNDRYPLRVRERYRPVGPVVHDDASIGANATLLPGVTVGKGAMVAAGAVVTSDVPAWTLAVGVPARIRDLPAGLREENHVKRRDT